MRKLILISLLIIPLLSYAGTTYHVDVVNGNDANSCATASGTYVPANAKKNITGVNGAYACLTTSTTDALVIHSGTYAEILTITKSGIGVGQEQTIQFLSGAQVQKIAQGSAIINYVNITGPADSNLNITDQGVTSGRLVEIGQNTYTFSYITLQGLKIGGTGQGGGGQIQCIRLGQGTPGSHVTLFNLDIEWCGQGANQGWVNAHAYSLGERVMPSNPSVLSNQRSFIAQANCTSNGEPAWTGVTNPPAIDSILNDSGGGGCSWKTAPGLQAGIAIAANYSLIDRVTLAHLTDGIAGAADYIVLRNNTFFSSYTDLGCPNGNAGGPCDAGWYHVDPFSDGARFQYWLLENNTTTKNDGPNGHGLGLMAPQSTKYRVLDRMNVCYDMNNGCGNGGGSLDWYKQYVQYNDTAVNYFGNQGQVTGWNTCSGGGCTDGIAYNNIFDTVHTLVGNGIGVNADTIHDYNFWRSEAGTLTGVLAEPHRIYNQVVGFVNRAARDLHLVCTGGSPSPACKAGTYLATAVGAGNNSTSLTMDKCWQFSDGQSGGGVVIGSGIGPVVNADWIGIGNTPLSNTVQISSINYSTCVATLAAATSWGNGDKLWLYKDSNGRVMLTSTVTQAPNMGAYQDSVSPSSQDFGTQQTGTSSAAQIITLSNWLLASPLTITSVVNSDTTNFGITNNCSSPLAIAAPCTVSVVFHPTTIGLKNATVTFTDGASDSPQVVNISGTGTNLSAPVINSFTVSPDFVVRGGQFTGTVSTTGADIGCSVRITVTPLFGQTTFFDLGAVTCNGTFNFTIPNTYAFTSTFSPALTAEGTGGSTSSASTPASVYVQKRSSPAKYPY